MSQITHKTMQVTVTAKVRTNTGQPWDVYFVFVMMTVIAVLFGILTLIFEVNIGLPVVTALFLSIGLTISSWIMMAINLSPPDAKKL